MSKAKGIRFVAPEPYRVGAETRKRHVRPVLATRLDRLYRTAIRGAIQDGPDFAGHYAVAKWGCGTGCQGFVIADTWTGKVYDPPFTEVDYHYPVSAGGISLWTCFDDLLNFSLASRLLVVEGCLVGKACGRHFFVMEPGGLREVQYDPDLLADGRPAPY